MQSIITLDLVNLTELRIYASVNYIVTIGFDTDWSPGRLKTLSKSSLTDP